MLSSPIEIEISPLGKVHVRTSTSTAPEFRLRNRLLEGLQEELLALGRKAISVTREMAAEGKKD